MTAKVLWINAATREITEVTIDDMTEAGVQDLRRLVGGGIELGAHWRNGDVLYCKNSWTQDRCRHFFLVLDQAGSGPIGGDAVIIGPDRPDRGSFDARMSKAEAMDKIQFLSRAEADVFIARIAHLPSATINGVVIETWGQTWAQIPRPPSEGENP